VTAVVATATVVFPRGKYRFEEDEGRGYRNLLRACREHDVEQMIFTSIVRLEERHWSRVPTLRLKLEIEEQIVESGLSYTILRAAPFMDDYFALMGSAIPLRSAEGATLRRPFWLSRLYLERMGTQVEDRGVAVVPGPVGARHSFVALDDVAELLVRSIGNSRAFDLCVDVGGPAALSWADVVSIYARILGRNVRAYSLPAWLLRAGMETLRPFSQAASNQLGILWSLASSEIRVDPDPVTSTYGLELTGAESFLRTKLASSAS